VAEEDGDDADDSPVMKTEIQKIRNWMAVLTNTKTLILANTSMKMMISRV
jgi:hypothetical protein